VFLGLSLFSALTSVRVKILFNVGFLQNLATQNLTFNKYNVVYFPV